MSKKFYCSFERLHDWVLAHHQDASDPYYGDYTDFNLAFTSILPIFDGTQTYTDPQTLHDQTPSTIYYPKLLEEIEDIIQIYDYEYEERLLARPLKVCKNYDQNMHELVQYFKYKVYNFVLINEEKYLRKLRIFNLKYNPIENVDAVEKGVDNTEYKGERTSERTPATTSVTADTVVGRKIEGQISAYTEGTAPTLDINGKNRTRIDQVSDTEAGKKGAWSGSGASEVPSITSGGDAKTSHFTTTYDDAAQNRLESYDKAEGDSASHVIGISDSDDPAREEIYTGSLPMALYKDTESFTNRKDAGDYEHIRYGNIGVTSSQDLIEQERKMADGLAIINEFCRDLNSEIFLSCY